jgi:hypothetical protein
LSRAREKVVTGGAVEAVVADLGEAAREDVREESRDEPLRGERAVLDDGASVVAVSEGDDSVVEAFETRVGDRDPEDVASEVLEDGVTGTGVLDVDDPLLAPSAGRDLTEKRVLTKSVSDLCSEEDGKDASRNEEAASRWGDPMLGVGRDAAGADEEVGMGVVEHRACPGVECPFGKSA